MDAAVETKPSEQQIAEQYHRVAGHTGQLVLGLMANLGMGPHFVAISASHMISLALQEIASKDKDAAGALADELSAGFVALLDRLGLMRDGGDDKAQG